MRSGEPVKAYRARVEITGGPTIDDVDVLLSERDPPIGPKSWEGRCVLPWRQPSVIPEELRLTLEDGRAGVALVRSAVVASGRDGLAITFQGNGPLE